MNRAILSLLIGFVATTGYAAKPKETAVLDAATNSKRHSGEKFEFTSIVRLRALHARPTLHPMTSASPRLPVSALPFPNPPAPFSIQRDRYTFP